MHRWDYQSCRSSTVSSTALQTWEGPFTDPASAGLIASAALWTPLNMREGLPGFREPLTPNSVWLRPHSVGGDRLDADMPRDGVVQLHSTLR